MRKVGQFLGVQRGGYDFSTRLNTSDRAHRDSNLERYIKRSKIAYRMAQFAKEFLPLGWAHQLTKSESSVEWDEDTLMWVRKELDSDSRTALEYAGLNPSYWPEMFPDESG
jgi:hypothetical protein